MSRTFHFLLGLALASMAMVANAGEFTQPRPGLHTGGQPTSEDLTALSQQGVHTVIDLRGAQEPRGFDEQAEAERLGLRYISLPISGKQDLTDANAVALHTLLEQYGDGVLLHCASGNRVGALMALMAAQQEGLTPDAALQVGRDAGLTSLEPVVAERLGLDAGD